MIPVPLQVVVPLPLPPTILRAISKAVVEAVKHISAIGVISKVTGGQSSAIQVWVPTLLGQAPALTASTVMVTDCPANNPVAEYEVAPVGKGGPPSILTKYPDEPGTAFQLNVMLLVVVAQFITGNGSGLSTTTLAVTGSEVQPPSVVINVTV